MRFKVSKKKYISLKEAAKISGYASDYIGYLIRAGKIPGKKVYSGVSLVTTEKAVIKYRTKKKSTKSEKAIANIGNDWAKTLDPVRNFKEIQKRLPKNIKISNGVDWVKRLFSQMSRISQDQISRIGRMRKASKAKPALVFIVITLITLLITGGPIALLPSQALVQNFYAKECQGDWENPQNSVNKPQLLEDSGINDFSKENSAYFSSGTSLIICEDFDGNRDLYLGKTFKSARLVFSLAAKEQGAGGEQVSDLELTTSAPETNPLDNPNNPPINTNTELNDANNNPPTGTNNEEAGKTDQEAQNIDKPYQNTEENQTNQTNQIEQTDQINQDNQTNQSSESFETEPALFALEELEELLADQTDKPDQSDQSNQTDQTPLEDDTSLTGTYQIPEDLQTSQTSTSPLAESAESLQTADTSSQPLETQALQTTDTSTQPTQPLIISPSEAYIEISYRINSALIGANASIEPIDADTQSTTPSIDANIDGNPPIDINTELNDTNNATNFQFPRGPREREGGGWVASNFQENNNPLIDANIGMDSWTTLGQFSQYPISNQTHEDYFSFELADIQSFEDLAKLQIKFQGLYFIDSQIEVYLDSVWIEINYEKSEIPTDQKPRIRIKNHSLVIASPEGENFRYDEEPIFVIEEPELTMGELIEAGEAEKIEEENKEEMDETGETTENNSVLDTNMELNDANANNPPIDTNTELNDTNNSGVNKKPAETADSLGTAYNAVVRDCHPDSIIANQEGLSSSCSGYNQKAVEGTGFAPVGPWMTIPNRHYTPPAADSSYQIVNRAASIFLPNIAQAKKNPPKVSVVGPGGISATPNIASFTESSDGIFGALFAKEKFEIKIPRPSQREFRPGLWKLQVELETDEAILLAEQDFTWGVLAINVNKSIYAVEADQTLMENADNALTSNEKAYIQMAVLDELGHTVCDASLTLRITNPNELRIAEFYTEDGTIQRSGECGPNNVTSKPDYFAYYQVGEIGNYEMTLSNLDNGYEITDSFEVRESVPFDVERIGPTRIYPPAAYEMTLKIKVNENFQGVIKEFVPSSFEITDVSEIKNPANSEALTDFTPGYKPGLAPNSIIANQESASKIKETSINEEEVPSESLKTRGLYSKLARQQNLLSLYSEQETLSSPLNDNNQNNIKAPVDSAGLAPATSAVKTGYLLYNTTSPEPGPTPFYQIIEKESTKIIEWQADWKAGETYELKYQFDAPDASPYLYLLGPLTFEGEEGNVLKKIQELFGFQVSSFKFQEARQWQVASDVTGGTLRLYLHGKDVSEESAAYNSALPSVLAEGDTEVLGTDNSATNFSLPPCEAAGFDQNTTARVNEETASADRCVATFYSPILGANILMETADTNSISYSLWASEEGTCTTCVLRARLYEYVEAGSTFNLIDTSNSGAVTAAGMTNYTWSSTPDTTTTVDAGNRLVLVITMFTGTGPDTSGAIDTINVSFDRPVTTPAYVSLSYTLITADKPSLVGSNDDDFEENVGCASSCDATTLGTPTWNIETSGNTTAESVFIGQIGSNSGSTQWLNITDVQTADPVVTSLANYTYVYQAAPSGDGDVTTQVSSSHSRVPAVDPRDLAGFVLRFSADTDFLILQTYWDGAASVVEVNDSGTLSGTTATITGNANNILLRWTKSGTGYQAKYCTSDTIDCTVSGNWTNLGSPITKAGTFDQMGLVALVGDFVTGTNTQYSASFEWFDSTIFAPTIDISGTCRQYDQTTNCANAETIRAARNASLLGQTGSTSGGAWTISGITQPTAGDVITVFIDAVADTNEAMAVTKWDGAGNITGVNLYERHLTIGSDDNQVIANADLGQYDNSVSLDEDIFHDVATNNLTACAIAGCTDVEIWIKSANTYQPASAGGTTNTTHDVEINGELTANGNTISLSGSWDNNSGFNSGTSTVIFTATTGTESIDSTTAATAPFNLLTLGQTSGTATWNLSSALDVNNNITIDWGTLGMNVANNINLAGNLLINANGNYTKGTGTFTFDGSGTNTWTNNGTQDDLGAVSINGTTKTINLGSSVTAASVNVASVQSLGLASLGYTLTLTGSGAAGSRPFIVAGTLNEGTSSTVRYSGTAATEIEPETYNNLNLSPSAAGSPTYTLGTAISQTITAAGNLTVGDGTFAVTVDWTFYDPAITLNGNLSLAASTTWTKSNSATLTWSPTGTKTWTDNNSTKQDIGIISISAGASTPIIQLSTGAKATTIAISAGHELQLNNQDIEITSGDLTTAGTGTITCSGCSSGTTLIRATGNIGGGTGAITFYNLTNTGAGTHTIQSAITVLNDWTVNNTTQGTGSVTVNGNILGSGTVNMTGGTVLQRVGASGKIFGSSSGSNNWTLYNLTFENSSAVSGLTITTSATGTGQIIVSLNLTLGNAADTYTTTLDNNTNDRIFDVNGDVVITSKGILQASNTASFTVGGNWTANSGGIFTNNSGLITFDSGTTGKTIADAGWNFYNILFNNSAGGWTYTNSTSTAPFQTAVNAGTATYVNALTGAVSVTGVLNVDWYLGTHIVDRANTATNIDTSDADITISENSSTPASTVWRNSGANWGTGASSQTTGTGADGKNPQPETAGAIRIREYSMTNSGACPGAGCTLYKYNMRINWVLFGGVNYGQYDYYADYGQNYLTSCLANGSACSNDTADDDIIGSGWYRATASSMNGSPPYSGLNEPATQGSWYAGMITGLSISITPSSVSMDLDAANNFTLDTQSIVITVSTSATNGFVVTAWSQHGGAGNIGALRQTATIDAYIDGWPGTNALPTTWDGNCPDNAQCGFGYNTQDNNLSGDPNVDRFVEAVTCGADLKCWAGFTDTGPGLPVFDVLTPTTNSTTAIYFKVSAASTQRAGPYNTTVIFIATATY